MRRLGNPTASEQRFAASFQEEFALSIDASAIIRSCVFEIDRDGLPLMAGKWTLIDVTDTPCPAIYEHDILAVRANVDDSKYAGKNPDEFLTSLAVSSM